uniref:Uncharacterized protein n=1 Tax=Arundo donax TaxID=35708 RepID=A0A0A8ZMU6_ARUDO
MIWKDRDLPPPIYHRIQRLPMISGFRSCPVKMASFVLPYSMNLASNSGR